jgi:hypothetical protein
VTYAPQSSPPLRRLPAFLLLVLGALLPSRSVAQARQRVTLTTNLTKNPGEQVLGTVVAGAEVATGQTTGDWTEVTIDGWMISRSVGETSRDGYNLMVRTRAGENVRTAPNGPVIARFSGGALLTKVEAGKGWTHVQRTLWAQTKALSLPGTDAPGAEQPGADRVEITRSTPMLNAPEGTPLATMSRGARGKVLARSGDLVRIQLEGWVNESDVKPAPGTVIVGLSQAEVRANPARYTGQTLEWRIQFIALQHGDELRPEVPPGQPYILARGPLPEPGFVYVIIPADRVEAFRQVSALQELTIRAIVKSPTTRYLPNPVVELVSVVKGMGN